jgi:hypothetical protein
VAVELADEAPRTDLPALSEQQPTATPTIAASRRDDFTVAVAPEAQRSDSNATSSAGTREVEHPVGRTLRALSEHLVGRIRTRASSASAAASVTAPSLPEHRLLEVAPSAPHAAAPLVPIRGANGRGQGVISTEGLLAGLLIALASLLGLGLRRAMRLVGRACKMRSASAEPACPPREDASEFAACPAWPARRPLSRRIGSSAHRLRGHEHSRERKARARRGDTRRELRRAPAAR